jgi:hypothetical protein
MAQRRYLIAGAKGGQGTTTVATVVAALAAGHGPTALVSTRPDDVCALTGSPAPATWASMASISANLQLFDAKPADGNGDPDPASSPDGDGPQHVVVDLGRLSELAEDHRLETDCAADTSRWLVVRGPCYLSLRAAIDHPWRPHGIVVLAEAGRPLTGADVSDVVGAPVIAQVPVEAAVARIIDAGLLLARLPRLSTFQSLARLLQAQPSPESAPAA